MHHRALLSILLSLGLLFALGVPGCTYPGGGRADDDDDASDDDDDDDNSDDDDDASDDDDNSDDDDDGSGCDAGEVEDCNGNCGPEDWLGDGDCDDGQWDYQGNGIVFNCAELDWDDGDCDGGDDDDDTSGDDDDASGGCTSHTQCDPDEFCCDGECDLIFGREFTLTFESAQADPYDSNGDSWESDPPDMYGLIKIDGDTVLQTDTVWDDLNATWNQSTSEILTATSLCFEVRNDDIYTPSEDMDVGCLNGSEAIVSVVRSGGYNGDLFNQSVAVQTSVSPNFCTPP